MRMIFGMIPAIILTLLSVKMFFIGKCFNSGNDEHEEVQQKLLEDIEEKKKAVKLLEDELAEMENNYNSDLSEIEAKRQEVKSRKDYVAELKTSFVRSLNADVISVPDFQALCANFTSAHTELDHVIADLQAMSVEFNLKYENWNSTVSAKKDAIEAHHNDIIEHYKKLQIYENTYAT